MAKHRQNEEHKPKEVRDKIRKIEVDRVKQIIETHYFPRYLTKKEAGTYMLLDDGRPPAFTEAVWEEMESQNQDFFRAYKIRIALKNQIARFNALLVSQSLALMAQNGVASGSLPNADPTCSTSAQVSSPNNIQRSMFPSTSGMYHPPSESRRRIPVANSGTVSAQMIDPSSGAMHHPRMNGPNFFPSDLVRAPGMNTPTGLMQQHRMNSVGRAPGPNMPTGVLTHQNRMNDTVRAPGMNMPPGLMQHMTNGPTCGSRMSIPTSLMQQPMMNGVVRASGMNAPAGPMQYRMNGRVPDNGAVFVNPRLDPSTRVLNGMNIGPGMYSPAPAPMYSASPYQQAMSSPYDLPPYDPDDQNQLIFSFSERTHQDMMERYDPPSEAMSFPFPQSTEMDIDGMFDGDFPARMMNGPPNGDFSARMMNGPPNGDFSARMMIGPPNGDFSERMMNGPAPNNSNSTSLNNFNASQGEAPRGPSYSYQNPRQDDQ